MKLLFWIMVVVVAVVLAAFAASNRESVGLELWPLPVAVELPLYIAMLGALAVGAVLGACAAWVAGARRLAALERELAAKPAPPAAAAARPPALVVRS